MRLDNVFVEVGMIVSKYIDGDFHTDDVVDWLNVNCPSFEKYMMVELDWEEKQERNCWFRFDVYFTNDKDAMLYTLRWL